MKIQSDSISNGYFNDKFGHRGTQFLNDKKPNRSFHLSWSDLPKNTKTLALVFIDHDAIPVCGFSWIHWTVANIDPNLKELTENASVEKKLLEGVTSWALPFVPDTWKLTHEEATGFGGCAPPDKVHNYTVELYALDTELNLKRGFYLNELITAMEGHILDKTVLNGKYKTK